MNQHRTATVRRSSRRHFLRGGVTLTAGSAAAMLLACGGDKDDTAGPATSSTTAAGTAAAAATGAGTPKRGGRLLLNLGSTTNNNSPFTDWQQGFVLLGQSVYDRLLSTRPGKEYVLEAAQSVEVPDPMTVIFKLKPGLKFQDRAPVSGRAVAATDVVKTQFHCGQDPVPRPR